MSLKLEKAIKLIKQYSARSFGVRNAYFKINDNKLEVLFIISKNKTPSLISYLNSLSSVFENEIKGLDIESSFIVYDKNRDIENIVKKEKFEEMNLKLASL